MQHMVKQYRRVRPDHFHDVNENARRLGILYTVEVELARVVGSWIARTPALPEKMTLGKVCYENADHAYRIEERLTELRVADDELAELRKRTAPALLQLDQLSNPFDFWAGLFGVVKPALLGDLRRHLDAAPPYVDEPTVRMLRHVIAEEEEQISEGMALLADRGHLLPDDVGARLRGGLWNLDAPDGGLQAGAFVGQSPVPAPVPKWPEEVELLTNEQPMPAYPKDYDLAMQRCGHDLVFSECEALDIFGQYVYLFPQFPWRFSRDAARIAWDEARHVELLLNVLERYGGHVGQFPAKAPGYEEFYKQDGLMEKIILVNVISEGEVSTDTQTQHRDAFREMGDELSATLKDYEMADEVVHGRFGLKWCRWLAEQTGADYEDAYARAKAAVEEFKSGYGDDVDDSPIPLLRIGIDETPDKRVVNVAAKRLVGFSDEQIDELAANASGTLETA